MLLWTPEGTEDKKEEEKEYAGTMNAYELVYSDFNVENRDYRSLKDGEWILIQDKIVRTVPENEYPNLTHDMSITIGNDKYDHILFVWVESTGDADFSFKFIIGAKNADDLNVLKTGDTIVLEVEIYESEDVDGTFEEIRGNVKDHPELVFDIMNTTPF
jgi:hypothetical protein